MLTSFKTKFIDKIKLTNNVYQFTFKLIYPKEISFIGGQYLILKVSGKPRLYSISSSSLVKNTIEFIIELVPNGLASNYLNSLNTNQEVEFQGPAGQFKLRESNKKKIFLITGTGIAPVKSILNSYLEISKLEFQVFWGLKNYSDVYLFEDLKEYNIKICLSRENDLNNIPNEIKNYFNIGHVDSCFFSQYKDLTIEQLNNYEYYLCGGRLVVESLKQSLITKGIMPENIIFEKF